MWWNLLLCAPLAVVTHTGPEAPRPQAGLPRRLSTLEGGVAFAGGEGVSWAGCRSAWLLKNGVGLELGVATVPQVLPMGALLVVPDLDAVAALPLGARTALLLRGGASAFAAVAVGNDSGAGAIGGFNLGASLLLEASPRHGLRVDYTARRIDGVAFSSVSLAFVSMGGRLRQ
jgi:hypothetical protein